MVKKNIGILKRRKGERKRGREDGKEGGRKEDGWEGKGGERKGKSGNPFSGVVRENFMEEVGPIGGWNKPGQKGKVREQKRPSMRKSAILKRRVLS